MFDFIPIQYYSRIYYYFLLLIVFIVFFRSKSTTITAYENKKWTRSLEILVLLFTLFYMGLRPLSWIFGDMGFYNKTFNAYKDGAVFYKAEDIVFEYFQFLSAKVMSASMFFFVCALLYVIPLWLACKKWFKGYSLYAFLALVASFSFWPYGTNGIRNGIATSIFLYALSRDKMGLKIIFILIAIGFHKSLIIPTAALLLTYFYADPKKYFYGWLICIPLSLIAGGFWEGLFASFIEDDRVSYLTTFKEEYKDSFSSSGFRWDFLLYSASAVYAACFFIFKKKFQNPIYNRLVSVFLAANAFWILVIRASFSNRFAYLSWFMMGIVIVYPFLTKIQVKNQHKVLGTVLLAYFSFTFLMNVLLV